ncbi:MAG: BACON domain-containing carbohydrate-binding protein [Paludibacteraceae bacterium]|nr:BACON domain-containing carbohydrate-binding protein [Paludibacteraceae bacterium]
MGKSLSWGKPQIKYRVAGTTGAWITMPTPVENTTKLTTSKGSKLEAKLEGGDYQDVKYQRNTYALDFELYMHEGFEKPISECDGIVADNYEFLVIPENRKSIGIYIKKGAVSAEPSFDTQIGAKMKYTVDVLRPDTEYDDENVESLILVSFSGLTANPATLSVAATQNVSSVTIGDDVDDVISGASWLTATKAGTVVTISAAANSGAARSAKLLVISGHSAVYVSVSQAAYVAPAPNPLVATPASLSFTADADAVGKAVEITSEANPTYSRVPSDVEWCTVTRSAKTITVKVSANPNSDERSTSLTVRADGKEVVVPITQAGVSE